MDSAQPTTPFIFSQSSLEVFRKCERQFYLQYLARRHFPPRPNVPSPEQEAQLAQGNLMHKYMERVFRGMDRALLAACAPTPIREWLEDACDFADQLAPGSRLPELTLSIPFGTARLTARYDLVVLGPDGQVTIVDWKTSSEPPSAFLLQQRMQHVMFPYVLTESSLLGTPRATDPSRVEMIYWFTADPLEPVRFPYSAAAHEQNRRKLQDMVRTIMTRRAETDFPKVADSPANRRRLCAYCSYIHYCERSATPATRIDLDDIFAESPAIHLQDLLDDGQELDF